MPDSSSGLSKVKRFSPVTGSVPTVAIIRPSTPAISPLTSDSPDERRDDAQAEHAEREIRRRRERERDARQRLGQQHEHDAARTGRRRNPEYSEMPSASPAFPCCFIA